jgi:hypothetical protein
MEIITKTCGGGENAALGAWIWPFLCGREAPPPSLIIAARLLTERERERKREREIDRDREREREERMALFSVGMSCLPFIVVSCPSGRRGGPHMRSIITFPCEKPENAAV